MHASSSSLLSPFELAPSPMISSTSRRPHCPQQDCPIQSRSEGFSSLPWVSLLDHTPQQLGLLDTADLSQLPLDRCEPTSSHIGPVRRRKTSFRRATPLRSAAGASSPHHRDRCPAPSIRLPFRDLTATAPSTPPRPRISRSRIIFHDLMPVFARDVHNTRSATDCPLSP
ncbi:hypothetical protein D9758_003258 [Tetrapyrgos nigripes]|uniref:Uncharacterized protein n=1 Tax=Tetrapyrgos nigripes TaxID=182062 RepID=A0A8H5GIJ2_9AGAR|nr:hypothetical protein D9758_003258 [Tetrapyrgos nigripes]